MKPTELRIGNYLQDASGALCQVEGIPNFSDMPDFEDKIYAPVIKGPLTRLPHNPIPLTEEWLHKLGFNEQWENSKGEYFIKKDEDGVSTSRVFLSRFGLFLYEESYTRDDIPEWIWIGDELEYVHQLQNLYFALTGEELTINQ